MHSLKIDVAKLSEREELVWRDEWDPQAWDLETAGLVYKSPLTIEVRAKRDSGLAVLQIFMKAEAFWTCDRCFKGFSTPLEKVFRIAYPLDLAQKVIPLDDDIREELLLSYPVKILCQKDCQGLCNKCGADLNKGKCKCQMTA